MQGKMPLLHRANLSPPSLPPMHSLTTRRLSGTCPFLPQFRSSSALSDCSCPLNGPRPLRPLHPVTPQQRCLLTLLLPPALDAASSVQDRGTQPFVDATALACMLSSSYPTYQKSTLCSSFHSNVTSGVNLFPNCPCLPLPLDLSPD